MKTFLPLLIGALMIAAVGCGDDDDSGASFPCDEGMVLSTGGEDAVCIDAHEMTNETFAAFLRDYGNECGAHECMHVDEPGARISLVEADGGTGDAVWTAQAGYEQIPVVQVTFHGAEAACEWLGKGLCSGEEWEAACGGSQGLTYPYGNDYSPEACNGLAGGLGAPVEVGDMTACEGGVDGLFDMSGNVYEWISSCADGPCMIRGGSFDKDDSGLTCAGEHQMDGPAGHREDLGLRCCGAPL